MINKLEFKTKFFLISIIFLLLVLWGCSQESTNPLIKNFHNTTARYNPYFIAKERMKEVEGIMWKNNVDDFNKILNVFPKLSIEDTAQIGGAANDGIKKASIAIQRHKNSKWTDRNFNLIGKFRFYMQDYRNAIETFKYVNTKGKDRNAKHAAMINLMRLFVETKRFEEAVAVGTLLRKEKLNRTNERDLNLIKAYYFAGQGDFRKVETYLGFAIPGVDELSVRSRYYFIIGQIRQKNNDNKGAYKSYRAAIKNTPTYEIAFYSRLNINQVADVKDKGDVKIIHKNFAKLLKDIRNEDFKDKIYYEMAKFELKQGHPEKATDYLKTSIAASTTNQRQKAYSYLLLGELNYETFKKYELAKAYYDSTISLLPPTEDIYEKTLKRQKSLENFVTQVNTIKLEDSLQRLAKMDTITLNQYFAKLEEEQKAKEAVAATQAEDQAFSSAFDQNPDLASTKSNSDENSNPSTWYFYSTSAISKGRSEFLRNWGNRPVEDNWRVSTRSDNRAEVSDQIEDAPGIETTSAGQTGSTFNRAQLLSQLPRTDSAMRISNLKIEEAYFILGKIYDQELEETSNSIQTFETMLKRFPTTEYKPEVYYYLYLLNGKLKRSQEEYKQKLALEFPNSFYNKLVSNPNYLSDNKKEEVLLARIYDQAYTLYERNNPERSKAIIDSISRVYPQNLIADKFALLSALISGKTSKKEVYVQNLQNFISQYPESPLVTYAQQLLSKAGTNNNAVGSIDNEQTIYNNDLDNKPHYFFIIYPSATDIDENLRSDILKYNLSDPQYNTLKAELINDNSSSKMMLLKEFKNKGEALAYYARFIESSDILTKYNGINLTSFIISDENFKIFKQNKDIGTYLSFFEKSY